MDYQAWLDPVISQQAFLTETLLKLTAINSGSLNSDGVNRVGAIVSELFIAHLNCSHEIRTPAAYSVLNADGTLTGQKLGDLHLLSKHPAAPLQILLSGHLDTVFPADSEFQESRWLADGILNGPGVSDMKGGILIMLQALKVLEASDFKGQLGWTVLLNSDEEIGSPGSASLLEEQAARHDLGLIYEPALPDGQLAGERKGSGNFTVIISGVAAHAGREHHLGRNALTAMAELITQLDRLNGLRQDVTLNVGVANGGVTTNQVPDRARCRFNIRTRQTEDELWCKQQIARVLDQVGRREGIRLTLHGGFGRSPKRLDQQHLELYRLVADCSQDLGAALRWQSTGGCCDGNNLSAAGLPNVDTLGVLGGKIHSAEEFINVDSLVSRSRLSALLLMRLARDRQRWIRPGRVTS